MMEKMMAWHCFAASNRRLCGFWLRVITFHLFKRVLILQKKLGADSGRGNGRRSKEEGKDVFNFFSLGFLSDRLLSCC